MGSSSGATAHGSLAPALFGWWSGTREGRDRLPWRSTRDPWHVLVSETMLAQTQATRVAIRFPTMIERFPTPGSCAEAPLGEVLRYWAGLGYNRRAVALHSTARAIVERHGGSVPRTLDELVTLPGVGPYTARAILAFAFGRDVGVVDTNVGRVLARAVAGTALGARPAQELADSLVPPGRGREWNLAVMDFGSLVCTARAPGCASCALAAVGACVWRAAASGASPDPAFGSAAVTTRQAPFAGSDREGRGRLVRAACVAPIAPDQVATAAGWPDDQGRATRVARDLVAEGLLVEGADGTLRLP
jgi:A/G-specific adenine glycosylase